MPSWMMPIPSNLHKEVKKLCQIVPTGTPKEVKSLGISNPSKNNLMKPIKEIKKLE